MRFGYFDENEIQQLDLASLGNADIVEYVEYLFIILFISFDFGIVLSACISAWKNVYAALSKSIKHNEICLQGEEMLNHDQYHQLIDHTEVITERGIHSAIHPLQVESPINFSLIRATEPYYKDCLAVESPINFSLIRATEPYYKDCLAVLAVNGYHSDVAASKEDDFDYLRCIVEPTDEYLTEYNLILYREIMGTEQPGEETSPHNMPNTNSSDDDGFDGLDPPEIIDWSELPTGEADPSAIPSWAVIPDWVFE